MKEQSQIYPSYPIFKGLQRPLEFMGVRGRYIGWVAGVALGSFVAFIISYVIIGFVVALIIVTVLIGAGIVLIFFKQRKGLHSKKNRKGIFIYKPSKETRL